MILRFRTRSSNAVVLVPNIREKVGLETFAGIWGSGSREWVNKHKTPTKQEDVPLYDL
jgi:hypothetical protein